MKHRILLRTSLLASAVAFAAGTGQASAFYVQTNLVSDIPGLATLTDPSLVNPWGISRTAGSPFWVSNQGVNNTTLYAVVGSTTVSQINVNPPPTPFVTIPTTAGGPQGPTGQVSNGNSAAFLVPTGTTPNARFIFANLNGTISGWAGGLTSTVMHTTPGAIYTGLAINKAQDRLYAANSAGGTIDVFDSAFNPITVLGGFTAPTPPVGLAVHNVQDIGGKVYVTYAPTTLGARRNAAHGAGRVDVFDENGNFQQTIVDGGQLAAPWGVALAPAGFGAFGGDLLIGNFSFVASEINAFDPVTGAFEGTIPISPGDGQTSGGLWGLMFGSGAGNGGDANTLYFADGIDGETHGLFGALTVPEPSSMALLGMSAAFLGVRRIRTRRPRA